MATGQIYGRDCEIIHGQLPRLRMVAEDIVRPNIDGHAANLIGKRSQPTVLRCRHWVDTGEGETWLDRIFELIRTGVGTITTSRGASDAAIEILDVQNPRVVTCWKEGQYQDQIDFGLIVQKPVE
jgi:hypothetical protein